MDLKNWLVPSVTFFFFVYGMIFVIAYTVKVGGANINFFIDEGDYLYRPKTETEKMLYDISRNFSR